MSKVKNPPAGEVLEIEAEEIKPVRTVNEAIKPELKVFDKYEARINELREQYGKVTIKDVKDKEGLENAKLARRELRTTRTGNESDRKNAKSFFLECGRAIDARAEWIEKNIVELEKPIDDRIKEIEAEVDRIKQEKINAEIERNKVRVQQLKSLGVEWDGANYTMMVRGENSGEDISYSAEVIRESDDDHFNNNIFPKFKAIFDTKEKIRIANEKAQQEEQERRDKERIDLEERERKVQEDQKRLKDLEDKIALDKKVSLQQRSKRRAGELDALGMVYNFQTESFTAGQGRASIHSSVIALSTDEEWEKFLEVEKPDIEAAKKALRDEQDAAERERADRKLAELKEAEKRQKEMNDLKHQEELELMKDKDKYAEVIAYLKKCPLYEMRSGQYRQKMRNIVDFLNDLK